MKKWTFWDIVILVLEVLSPIIAIIITIVFEEKLDPDNRLAIIGTGISIPVVLLQISLTQGQNKNANDLEALRNNLLSLDDKIRHMSPVLEQVFLSRNERMQRFAYRRFGEVCKTIQMATSNNKSGNLRPYEYYEELLYLADLILKDKTEQKNKFSGEIWAMTGFADDEWIADDGYEKLWTDKLKEMVDINGIKTRRLCLLPDSVYDIITAQTFVEPSQNDKSFWGFIELLDSYYKSEQRKKITEHFIIRARDNPELEKIKGFFAIKLTNGDLHILYGETVDANGALTAEVLFDPAEIQTVRARFELYTKRTYRMENKLPELVKNNGFLSFLTNRGVSL